MKKSPHHQSLFSDERIPIVKRAEFRLKSIPSLGKRTMANDTKFMKEAIREAEEAGAEGEVPVGAVVVFKDEVIARGKNQSINRNDPTAHAEVLALRDAAQQRKNYRLNDCDLYVTLEPCMMCLGSVIQARIKRLVYGAPDPKAGAVRSIIVFPFDKVNHRPEILEGVLEEECKRILKRFFEEKRKDREETA